MVNFIKITDSVTRGWLDIIDTTIPVVAPPADTFVMDVTQPGPSNTGVGIASLGFSVPTTVVNGDVTLSTNGTSAAPFIYQNKIIKGKLIIRAQYVIVQNCIIQGANDNSSGNGWLVDCVSAALDAFPADATPIIRYCTIKPSSPSSYWNGIGTRNYRAFRNDISNSTDGFSIFHTTSGGNVRTEIGGNYVHDLGYFNPDLATPSHTDGTHNDCVQYQGGNGGYLHGNTFDGHMSPSIGNPSASPHGTQTTSCVILNNNTGVLTGFEISYNWLYGGVETINGGGLTVAGASGNIHNNQIKQDQYLPGYDINLKSTNSGVLTADNFVMDTSIPATVRRNQ